jgi:hypothetical protein
MSEFLPPSQVKAEIKALTDKDQAIEYILNHLVDYLAAEMWVPLNALNPEQVARLIITINEALATDPRVDHVIDSGVIKSKWDPVSQRVIHTGETIKESIREKLESILMRFQ